LTNVSGTLFFSADDGNVGHELWKSDGTPGGTVLVRDINPASGHSYPRHLANVNGTLFFAANDGTRGHELWKSDGTSTGTVLVKDIRPGPTGLNSSNPYSLTNVVGRLFFIANDGTNGRELWISDGTSTGTVLVKDINQGAGHAFGTTNAPPPSFTNVNGTLFFWPMMGCTVLSCGNRMAPPGARCGSKTLIQAPAGPSAMPVRRR
jgi:ELWxxDGT repeat protein